MNARLEKAVTWLTSGEFNYRKYENSYHDKFNRPIDIMSGYICQVPYFKIIGGPIGILIMFTVWSPYIAMAVWYTIMNKFKFTKGKKS